jgi:hypothetical protein
MYPPTAASFCVLLLTASPAFAQPPAIASTPLPAGPGWRAERIHKSDGGVWYAHIDKVVDAYGQNEVIAGDDKGRLLLLTVYSGQWTAHSVVCDGQWLAPTCSSDVDPRVPGRELYAGGKSGTVHRVVLRREPFARFHLESIEIGHAAAEEFHAVVAADLVPGGSEELLAFGITGATFQLSAEATGDAFTMRRVATLPGRVRNVVVEPGPGGGPASVFGVARSGDWLRLQLRGDALHHEVLLHEDCGLGRIAKAKGLPGVFYLTRDDGVVLRVQIGAGGVVAREPIFAGGQGLRGIASGRFFADGREAVAAYGYDKTVQPDRPRGWRVAGRDRVHVRTAGPLARGRRARRSQRHRRADRDGLRRRDRVAGPAAGLRVAGRRGAGEGARRRRTTTRRDGTGARDHPHAPAARLRRLPARCRVAPA